MENTDNIYIIIEHKAGVILNYDNLFYKKN